MKFQYDNVSFYYDIQGSGAPLLFLHGNGEDHTYFARQIPFFVAHGFQCISMGMRGHGQSSFGKKALDFTVFAKDVKAMLAYLHIDKICMIGFSDGANTVMQFALDYPQMIDSMVLNGGNLNLKGLSGRCQIEITIAYDVLYLFSKVSSRFDKKMQIIRLMAKHPNIQKTQLERLDIPTLIIVGEKDMIKRSHSLKMKEYIHHASFVEIAKGDHFIAQTKANKFNLEVLKFLKGETNGK